MTIHADSIPGLICLWDFQPSGDHPGGDLTSKGPHRYTLQEMNGPIARSPGGVLGANCLAIERGQWLRIPRRDCPALDLHGRQPVTVIAWIQRHAGNVWQYIAGVWDERRSCRQYALFTSGHKQTDCRDLTRSDAEHQAHGYISDVGGATPDCKFCFSYATGRRRILAGEWMMVAFTYDLQAIRVYVDGVLDANGNCNPFLWDKPIFDGGEDGADFTIAQRSVPSWPDYPAGAPDNEVGFDGLLGGVAVCDQALSDTNIAALAQATGLGPNA